MPDQRQAIRACAAAVAVALFAVAGPAHAQDPPPNIVVVMTDDQRADTLRYMPTVRELAREGTSFRRHYAVQPLCCPSRASFLTGQYPHNHGITHNHPLPEAVHAIEDRALPVVMQEAGYRTGFLGKYLNGYGGELGPPYVPLGWDEFLGIVPNQPVTYMNTLVSDGSVTTPLEGYQANALGGLAEDFITRGAGEQPFFLVVMPQPPHIVQRRATAPAPEDLDTFAGALPPTRPDHLGDKPRWLREAIRSASGHPPYTLQWQRHLEALQSIDRMVAGIVERLKATGHLANTVLFFTSDNGYLMGEHRLTAKDQPYRESVQVPLVVSGPGFHAGATQRLTANIDMPVTIAELSGTSLPDADGRDLRSVDRSKLLLEGQGIIGPTAEGLILKPWHSLVFRSGRTFIDWQGNGAELYSASDPYQQHALDGEWDTKRKLIQTIQRLASR